MIIGYARVSTVEQNLDLQIDALSAAKCEKIFQDKQSGAKENRAGLAKVLQTVNKGDCLIVWRLDRLARSVKQLIEIVMDLERRGIQFKSLTEQIDTTTATGKLIFHLFAALAEFERNLIRERTKAGLDAARARGRKGGRKPVLNETKKKAALQLLKNNSFGDVAKTLNVSERTLRRLQNGEYQTNSDFSKKTVNQILREWE